MQNSIYQSWETPEITIIATDNNGVAIMDFSSKKSEYVQYSDCDHDLFDCFLHNTKKIIGFNLKKTLVNLVENGLLTWVNDITDNLIDPFILEHLINEDSKHEINTLNAETELQDVIERYTLMKWFSNDNFNFIMKSVEWPLIKVLVDIETSWIQVNTKYLVDLMDRVDWEIITVWSQLRKILWTNDINISSPKQIWDILFGKMWIVVKDKWRTKAGGVSISAQVLNEIAIDNPDVSLILTYRELLKIKTTYIEPLLCKVKNWRIHATFNQIGTSTGRLSSSNPNLQNIPVSTDYNVRTAFESRDGYILMSADYSQIELRVLAKLSEDKHLTNAFSTNADIHQETADLLWISRNHAKWVNFGIVYGISGVGLATQLWITEDEATALIKKYFIKFEWVKKFIKDTQIFLEDNYFEESMFGRQRHFVDYKKLDTYEKRRVNRQAVNARIQGTAADIMKIWLVNVSRALSRYDAKILLTIHDEIILEVKSSEIEEVQKIVEYQLGIAWVKVNVPLIVNTKIFTNWWTKV